MVSKLQVVVPLLLIQATLGWRHRHFFSRRNGLCEDLEDECSQNRECCVGLLCDKVNSLCVKQEPVEPCGSNDAQVCDHSYQCCGDRVCRDDKCCSRDQCLTDMQCCSGKCKVAEQRCECYPAGEPCDNPHMCCGLCDKLRRVCVEEETGQLCSDLEGGQCRNNDQCCNDRVCDGTGRCCGIQGTRCTINAHCCYGNCHKMTGVCGGNPNGAY